MRRRYFLSSAAAPGAGAVAPALGQQKLVFLHYTQEQLELSQLLYALMKV